jgi:AcrR family transcriptional regulator
VRDGVVSSAPPVDDERPSGPKSSKGVRTRARLVDAAKEIFEEHGFLEARIADIAERAGCSYGSFYHYFNSKEEIFREVADAQEKVLAIDRPLATIADAPEVGARLRLLNREYLSEYRSEARIMGVVEQMSRYDEMVGRSRFERHERYAGEVAEAIRQLQEWGILSMEIDPVVVSFLLTAMVTKFAESLFVDGQLKCSFEAGVVQLNRVFSNALRLYEPPLESRGID